MTDTLLAVVSVDEAQRVMCQAPGCGRGVHRGVHVVRASDGSLGVFGYRCFLRLFSHIADATPRYGSARGKDLTPAERHMLAENTAQLIAQLEAEQQVLEAQHRARQAQYNKLEQASPARQPARTGQRQRLRMPSFEEYASVEREAKAAAQVKNPGVDLDLPGNAGLWKPEARRLLGY